MPGLICAVGVDGSDEIVRRAAGPLLRREWHHLALEHSPDRAALGFCGERGGVARDAATGVIAAVDGEILSGRGVETGPTAAATILERYVAQGAELEAPEGWFSAAVWDPRGRSLHLVADRFGQRPLYFARHLGGTLVASELKALVAGGLEPRLGVEAWAEMLAFEYPLGESVPLAGVRLVPQAATLTLLPSGQELLRERWRYRVEPAASADEREFVAEVRRRLERAVHRRLTPQTGLALSSGLDSRSMAAVIRTLAPDTLSFTYGAAGSEDLVGGTKLAAGAGLRHRALPLEPGYIARGAAETVWLGEGHVRCFHAHHLSLRQLRPAEGLRAVLMGFAGDVIMRGRKLPLAEEEGALADAVYLETAECLTDRHASDVLTASFAADIAGLARASVARHLAAEEGDQVARRRQFGFRHNRPRMLWGSELFADDLAPRDPYHDIELIDLCRRMPESFRIDGRLHRSFLSGYPELASVPNPKDSLPPSLSGWRRGLAARAVKVRRRARDAAGASLGLDWRPSRAGLGDYASDLRVEGAELLGVLLEPRTLERGQLREEPVRRRVTETLSGRARHTRMLGMLLTFELFQRQFLEGDGPPPSS